MAKAISLDKKLDYRHMTAHPVWEARVIASWASGDTGQNIITIPINGTIQSITVFNETNTNAQGVTVTIDDSYNDEIYTSGVVAHNSVNIDASVLAVMEIPLTLTIAGDPGATGASVQVIIRGT